MDGSSNNRPGGFKLLVIETNRSSFWARNRSAVLALVLFSALALLIGCGGGGGGGGGGNGGNTGTIPNAPTGVSATPGNAQITVQWTASSGATSYNVLRSLAPGGPFTARINLTPLTSFTDTGLTNGTTYFYKVTANNTAGTSGDSNVVSATPTAGSGGSSWLPGNTIFYLAADNSDPAATDLRKISEFGTGDSLFALMPAQFTSVAPNPNVTNQLVFAYTTDAIVTVTTTYELYRNTSVSLLGAVKLTDHTANPFSLIGSIGFTLDGQKIFFTAQVGSDHGLYVMNPNGTGITRIATADDAKLSPDGSKILISQPAGGQNDLYYINTTDINSNSPALHPVLVTTTQDEIMPQWSKDGTKIVFSSESTTDPTPNFEIFVVPFGSSSVVQLTGNGDDNFSPSLSPNGTQVAFARVSNAVLTSGLYKAPTAGGASSSIILNPSIGTSVYWTSNQGRAIDGATMSLGRSLKQIRRMR